MKIVIAGAGAVGAHLANLLSNEDKDITLIDLNEKVLVRADQSLDILTIQGDAISFATLEEARVGEAELFIAVTTSEKTNILSCILAKQAGAKKTIARVTSPELVSEQSKEAYHRLGVDVLISVSKFASLEIQRLLERVSFTDLFEFESGKLFVFGFTLEANGPLEHKTIDEIHTQTGFPFKEIALLRGHKTLIPNKKTRLQRGDHLYICTPDEYMSAAKTFIGKRLRPLKKVMIIGDTLLALQTAQLIENDFSVTVVVDNEKAANKFVRELDNSLVIQSDPSEVESLREAGLDHMDAFVGLTPNSETNIIASLVAEEMGVRKTVALVEDINYTHISQNIGIDTIINMKLTVANNIFRFVRKGKVEAIASLHGVDAEIIEFVVSNYSKDSCRTVGSLDLPPKAVVAGIVRGEEGIIPDPDFEIKVGDKIVVLALHEAIGAVEKLFV